MSGPPDGTGPDGFWYTDFSVQLMPGAPPLPSGQRVAVVPQGPNKDQCPGGPSAGKYSYGLVSSDSNVKKLYIRCCGWENG